MDSAGSTEAIGTSRALPGIAETPRVRTRRFVETLTFYLALGCEIQLAADGWAQLGNAGKQFILTETSGPASSLAGQISTADLYGLHRRLRDLGIATSTITYPASAAAGQITVYDPDQHLVAITQRGHAKPPTSTALLAR